jgi:hypothetical protein
MKRLCLGFGLLAVLALSATVTHAADYSVVGVVTRIEPTMMEVQTDSGDTRLIALEPDTQYMKWVMEKSWAQDLRADSGFLRVGDRVRIRLRQGQPTATARKVWIVVADRSEG